jgi:hypothetical protein
MIINGGVKTVGENDGEIGGETLKPETIPNRVDLLLLFRNHAETSLHFHV